MKAFYGRVSIEDQSMKGYGLKNQIDECKKKIGNEEHLTFLDEGISGEILNRPGLTKLRESVQSGLVTEIICYDPDRLSRKLVHQLILDEEFSKKGVFVKFVNGEYAQTAEGQLFKNIRGSISEFEKEKIKQRTKGGKLAKAREGKVLGNYGLYGYDYDYEKKTYKIKNDQAEIVKMIFDYFTDGKFKGINGIALHLTQLGIPTAKGKTVWHRQVVRQMLMNVSYTGKHPHNKYNTEGDYVRKQSGQTTQQTIRPEEEWIYVKIPPIIEEEQFANAQELLSQARRRFAKGSVNQYLLSGLIRCNECKNTMVGMPKNWWGKTLMIYSDKKNTSGAKNTGCGNYAKVNEIDEVVWEQIADILNNPEKILSYKKSTKESGIFKNELQYIEKELEKNKKGRQRLISLVAMSDDIDLSDVKDQIEELQLKEKGLQKQYKQIETELKALGIDNSDEMMERAIELSLKHKETLNLEPGEENIGLSFEDKKEVVRSLVKQIYVGKDDEIEIHIF